MGKTVLVAGLGLIGGSLAISIKNSTDAHIIGFDISKNTIDYALINGIIDEASADFSSGVLKADIVILAAPVSKTVELISQLQYVTLDKPIIMTDVASVKAPIMEAAELLNQDQVTFIGGHPMAGSHKKGIHAAKGHLFENAIYILAPLTGCPPEHLDTLKELLAGTKSKFLSLEPKEHDEMTSVISHFPHLIASSLVHQAKKWEQTHAYIPTLAAGGFRDITRIASSNPQMWRDIFFHNQNGITNLLGDWINEMQSLKELLETNDKESMFNYLQQAKEYRDRKAHV